MIKLFSFLGTNHYAKTRYYLEDDEGCFECETSFIQEALIDYLLQKMAADEKLEVTLLLTRLARSKNFEENKEAENTGFKAILKKYPEQVVVKTIDVEDGKNAINDGDYYLQNIPSSYMSKNAVNFYRNGNRNDVSHAGMEQKPISSEEIVKEAQRAINQFEGLFLKFLPGKEEQQ